MRLIVTQDSAEMSAVGAQHLLGAMHSQHRVNISITAGATPQGVYEIVVPQIAGKPHFDHVHYYNFDEIPIAGDESGLGETMTNLNRLFFDPAAIDRSRVHVLDASNDATWDAKLADDGGLDLIFMGLGTDGHFCGNLPGATKFGDLTTRVNVHAIPGLAAALGQAEDGDEAKVPDFYVTMGPKSVMLSRKLVMIVDGEHKAEAVKALVEGPVTESFPSSILTLHPDFTLIIDRAAASRLS